MSIEEASSRVQAIPPIDPDTGETRFINRDLSWLEFNRRVLHQALDDRTPLLERLKFLAIYSNNLDEFFQKRVGLQKRRIAENDTLPTPEGLTPQAVIDRCREMILEMQETQSACYDDQLLPALEAQGIRILRFAELEEPARKRLDEWFNANVFPVLTPLAVDPGHRFPFISNLSENLGVLVCRPGSSERHFARIKIPDVLPRLVSLDPESPDGQRPDSTDFVPLDEIILANLDDLFPGLDIAAVTPFRVTRSAALGREADDDDVEDLLEYVEEELHLRRFANAVRLEFNTEPDPTIRRLLINELHLAETDVYQRGGPLEYTDLFKIASLPRPELKESDWTPVTPARLADDDINILDVIREGDILVHHPYDSFDNSVERFIEDAANDPDVLAIKQTIYRTSRDSPFVASMIKAAEAGKAVACLVELRARFDEHRNVTFARQLEQHGVHVAYGVVGLKTHCKCSLVVRREGDKLRCYAHIGTGNYHPDTAQLYTDVGVLTADPVVTADVVGLFNELTGRAHAPAYKRLVVAPHTMRKRFAELIDREIDNAKAGKPARIIAKINSMEDRKIAAHLYDASKAGVKIDLIVRGFCCLRPGVEGMSENIRVISVVGRFLEHSRIFAFANGSEDMTRGDWLISSADWMYRNLNNRVEAALTVTDDSARVKLWHSIDAQLRDHVHAWDMNPDGSYTLRHTPENADPNSPEALGLFQWLMNDATSQA